MTTVRVALPPHLRTLADVGREVEVTLEAEPPTIDGILDALEAGYPVLRGTIRRHGAGERRPLMRFFACGKDLSHEPLDAELPGPVASGDEPLLVVGAIAGG